MDTTPVTARSLGNTCHVDGDNLERSYKYHLSDYSTWVQKDHAGDWVLVPDNIGEHLCIDETSLQDDLFTILSNKAGHGRQGTIISMVRGTKACEVIKVLIRIPEEDRLKVKEKGIQTSFVKRGRPSQEKKETEILYIFFGTHTVNVVPLAEMLMEQQRAETI